MLMFSSVLSAVKIVSPPFLKNATYTEMAIITFDKTITQKKEKNHPKNSQEDCTYLKVIYTWVRGDRWLREMSH